MSAIIGGLIPKIEGFQPIPNAVMIPFMEAQSAALAYGFGLNYEYGKRKIRSMSNDEFNSLTSEQITNMSNEHTHIILSKFQAQVPNVMPMQREIFNQYVKIEIAKVKQNVELAKWVVDYAATGASEGIEDFFAHLQGKHTHSTLPTSTLDSNRPTTIAQAATTSTSPTTTTSIPTTQETFIGPPAANTFTGTEEAKQKIIKNIENNITNLKIRMEEELRKQNWKSSQSWILTFRQFGYTNVQGVRITPLMKELNAQYKQLKNIKAGLNPY